jgi:hypothetical protein
MNDVIITVISFFSLVLAGISLFLSIKNIQKHNRLTTGISGHNLEIIIQKYVQNLQKCENDIQRMNRQFEIIREETSQFFRKFGIVRFQAFEGTGGDQSFSMALLDAKNNGFIISGLYGRDFSKVYAKEIIGGKVSKYKLTSEEENALKKALQS